MCLGKRVFCCCESCPKSRTEFAGTIDRDHHEFIVHKGGAAGMAGVPCVWEECARTFSHFDHLKHPVTGAHLPLPDLTRTRSGMEK